MNLNIFVSNKCFIYCRGCYSYSREEKCNKLLETDKIVDFLKYAYSKGIRKVTLCGGDPLAREDIIYLIKKIKSIGLTVSLDTLGTPLIRDARVGKNIVTKIRTDEITKLVDCIGIPIDGSKNKIIKLFRPINIDILNEQISICKLLIDNGANICINTVAHKGNLDDAKELAKTINEIGNIKKWQIFQYAPFGKYGSKNREMFEISDEQFEIFKKNILSVYNTPEKVEFKKTQNRVNHYLLIDNSGNTWVPKFERKVTDYKDDMNSSRLIIGNICNNNDWKKICEYAKKLKK